MERPCNHSDIVNANADTAHEQYDAACFKATAHGTSSYVSIGMAPKYFFAKDRTCYCIAT